MATNSFAPAPQNSAPWLNPGKPPAGPSGVQPAGGTPQQIGGVQFTQPPQSGASWGGGGHSSPSAPTPAAGGGSSPSLLGTYPGLFAPPANITSAYRSAQLPYDQANEQHAQNRDWEAATGGQSRQQMLQNVRPASSGLLRSGGDQSAMASELARRSGAGAEALTTNPLQRDEANAQAKLGNQLGTANDLKEQYNNLVGLSNDQGNYNLSSLLSGMNTQYGNAANRNNLFGSVLGGLFGNSGLLGSLSGKLA